MAILLAAVIQKRAEVPSLHTSSHALCRRMMFLSLSSTGSTCSIFPKASTSTDNVLLFAFLAFLSTFCVSSQNDMIRIVPRVPRASTIVAPCSSRRISRCRSSPQIPANDLDFGEGGPAFLWMRIAQTFSPSQDANT